jgi:hypothetical protein
VIAMLVWNLKSKIFNVETSFLREDLKKEIFMDIPKAKGMDFVKEEFLSLNKTIYGSGPECKAVLH